jgi:hypothetical protein
MAAKRERAPTWKIMNILSVSGQQTAIQSQIDVCSHRTDESKWALGSMFEWPLKGLFWETSRNSKGLIRPSPPSWLWLLDVIAMIGFCA